MKPLALTILLLATLSLASCAAFGAGAVTGYTVQLGAYRDKDNAAHLVDSLRNSGVNARVERNGSLFLVWYGSFASESEAESAGRKLLRRGGVTSYLVKGVQTPAHEIKTSVNSSQQPPAGLTEARQGTGIVIARTAERFVGLPYKWGGNNVVEGLDCSGFTKAVYGLVGISIPRTSSEQFQAGIEIQSAELQEGDLVFFGPNGQVSHVGIYVGNGRFVHAPSRNELIKITALADGHYQKRFIGARRLW